MGCGVHSGQRAERTPQALPCQTCSTRDKTPRGRADVRSWLSPEEHAARTHTCLCPRSGTYTCGLSAYPLNHLSQECAPQMKSSKCGGLIPDRGGQSSVAPRMHIPAAYRTCTRASSCAPARITPLHLLSPLRHTKSGTWAARLPASVHEHARAPLHGPPHSGCGQAGPAPASTAPEPQLV